MASEQAASPGGSVTSETIFPDIFSDTASMASTALTSNISASTTDNTTAPAAAVEMPANASTKAASAQPNPRSANISIRNYIYFLPYPLPQGTPIPYTLGLPNTNPLNLPPHGFEPTHTLVLTSPGKTFVDIRIFRYLLTYLNFSTPKKPLLTRTPKQPLPPK
jgi:hypothetical protein